MFKKHKKLVKRVNSLTDRVDDLFALLKESGLIKVSRGFGWGQSGYDVSHYVSCLRWELDVLVEGLGYEIAMEPEKAIEPKIVLRKKVKEPEKEPESHES
jgi:hypothetical protein